MTCTKRVCNDYDDVLVVVWTGKARVSANDRVESRVGVPGTCTVLVESSSSSCACFAARGALGAFLFRTIAADEI